MSRRTAKVTCWTLPAEEIQGVLTTPLGEGALAWFQQRQPDWDQRSNRWKIGRSTFSDPQLLEAMGHEGVDVSESAPALQIIKNEWAKLSAAARDAEGQQAEKLAEWRAAWRALVAQRWTPVDEQIWKGCRYTQMGDNLVLLAPTGRGSEYRPIGTRPEDVAKWLGSVKTEAGNMLTWIQKHIVDSVVQHCVGNGGTDVTDISVLTSGAIPSCMCINSIAYAPTNNQEGEMIGYHLLAKQSPTVWTYLKSAFEVLMSRPELFIADLSDVTNDPDVPTLRYLNLGLKSGPHPTWDSWLETGMETGEERHVFKAWVGSVLVAKNKGKQALWLHGHGDDGKSVVSGVLGEYLGELAVAINGKSMANQFGAAKVEGKRLVIVGDGKNQKLLASEWAHSLTGGDIMDIERKGRDSYSQKVYAKLLVCSNLAPEIRVDERNMTSRLIYIKLRRRSDQELEKAGLAKKLKDGSYVFLGNAEFPSKLREEVEYFLATCVKFYEKMAPTHAQIIQPSWMAARVKATCADPRSEAIISWIEDHFEQGTEEDTVTVRQLTSKLQLTAAEYGLNHRDGFVLSELYTTLNNLYGATRRRVNLDGARSRVVTHLKMIGYQPSSNETSPSTMLEIGRLLDGEV